MSGEGPAFRNEDERAQHQASIVDLARGELLAPLEFKVIADLGQVWNDLCQIVDSGPTRDADLAEAVHHIHALQKMIMGQAAARAYPSTFRLLGGMIQR